MKYLNTLSIFVILLSLNSFASSEIIKCFNSTGKHVEVEFGFNGLKARSINLKHRSKISKGLRTSRPTSAMKTYKNSDFKVYIQLNRKLTKVSKVKLTSLKTKKVYSFSSRCLSIEGESSKAKKINSTIVSEKKSRYKIFNKVDELGIIKLKLKDSPLDFRYDILYYIPKRVKQRKDLEVLVLLHGGGESTVTRSGSIGAIEMYTKSMMKMARSLGVALVMPSATGLNWSAHTITYLKEIKALIQSDLPVYDNRIGLIGHSMGAMGIMRSLPYLTDDYSFFVSLAGGAESKSTTDSMLKPYYNTSYTHIQGENDLLNVFIPRSKKHNEKLRDLELRLNEKIDSSLIMHSGGHDFTDYKFDLLGSLLLDKIENRRINFYKRKVFGVFSSKEGTFIDQYSNGNHYFVKKVDSLYWLRVTSFNEVRSDLTVEATIDGQNLNITAMEGIKSLRVYLSHRMLDIKKSIHIKINDAKNLIKKAVCKGSDNRRYSCYIDLEI